MILSFEKLRRFWNKAYGRKISPEDVHTDRVEVAQVTLLDNGSSAQCLVTERHGKIVVWREVVA